MGFREIVAANPLLFTGVYVILAMGGMLFLLGFLGCCGAIRENKCLLLFVSLSLIDDGNDLHIFNQAEVQILQTLYFTSREIIMSLLQKYHFLIILTITTKTLSCL